jgi:hypothetical protein
VVRYVGPLNEDTAVHLHRLKTSLGPQVVFDLKDVDYVNSSGIRTWVLFLRALAPGRDIAYERCSPTIVTQLNMIPGFGQGVDIRSVFVPFACISCSHVANELFSAADFPRPGDTVPPRPCPKCGSELQLADAVEEYFEFTDRG